MEARTIWVLDRATNTHVKIITDATTFGELKQAAKAAGVNYEGKDWREFLNNPLFLMRVFFLLTFLGKVK